MPKYKVLRPIEHNLKLYLPEAPSSVGERSAPPEGLAAPSASHGRDVPVDVSGVIELSDAEAAALVHGQIEPVKQPSRESKKSKS